jgi:molybdopterin synthase catalytic subunit
VWCGLMEGPLPIDEAYRWALRPDCGAVVLFTGTARDHSEGRPGVHLLEYEAYEDQVVPRLRAVVAETRTRFPEVGRMVAVHRTGAVPLTEAAVVVVAASAHRAEAFEAARYCIDTLKVQVPVWKREHWEGGQDWAQPCTHVGDGHGVGHR